MIPATITTEVLEHADGRPIAYVDATAVVVFAYQEPDGTCVIDIFTREEIGHKRLAVRLDGQFLNGPSGGRCCYHRTPAPGEKRLRDHPHPDNSPTTVGGS